MAAPGEESRSVLRLLTFSSLFPNPIQPRHGLFVAARLRQMVRTGRVAARIVAPVPWFPFTDQRFGRYAEFARVPERAEIGGLQVEYPRYPVLPKVGMSIAPILMARAVAPAVTAWASDSDLLDAHFLYPDGVAAVAIARRAGMPVVLTARGSDVNQFGQFILPRRWLHWAITRADHVFAVSQALAERLLELNADPGRLSVVPNGVDLGRFRLQDRRAARARLGLPDQGPLLLSVGNLLPLKGHDILVEALAALDGVRLLILGEGPCRRALEALIEARGLADRVRLVGAVEHERLPDYYGAADASLLASSREGMPNVLLESLACGTPVIASAVGGVPEVVDSPAAGYLVHERSPRAFADAIRSLLASPPERASVRRRGERFAWEPVINRQIETMQRVVHAHGARQRRESS